MGRTVPIREARRILREHGFEIINQGAHEVWGTEDGQRISLPNKPVGGELYGFMAQAIRRIERGERAAKDRVEREG